MASFVRRITQVSLESGATQTVFKTKKKGKKRKVSGWLKPLERSNRKSAKAMKAFSDTWLSRHERSNRKRRNGWMRDAIPNWLKASRKAFKKLRGF